MTCSYEYLHVENKTVIVIENAQCVLCKKDVEFSLSRSANCEIAKKGQMKMKATEEVICISKCQWRLSLDLKRDCCVKILH